ncbi:MAG: hypothetical protein WC775_03470 [Patescibacteria group bacterium]
MRKLFATFLLLFTIYYLLSTISSVHAADPVPTPEQTTCDLCGKCTDIYLNVQPTPSNWSKCAACLYPPSSDTLRTSPNADKAFTVLGCIQTSSGGFTSFFVNLFTSLMVGVSFLGIVFGAIKVMLARGDRDALIEGKRYVYGSLLALFVVLFAVFIVKLIGGTILKIPYMQ